jgi:DNA-binding NarL/FixJ family response regulator
MSHVAVIASSPLLGNAVLAALTTDNGLWQVQLIVRPQALLQADAAVLCARDSAEASGMLDELPSTLPVVVMADDLHALARRQTVAPRALALLGADSTGAQLRAATAAVLQGLSVRLAQATATWPAAQAFTHEPLTPRELEVFELIGKGLSNADIAGVLSISAHTAKFHVGQILAKLGAATRTEAVSSGLKMGLIGL